MPMPSTPPARLLAAVACAAVALGVAACGSDSSSDTQSTGSSSSGKGAKIALLLPENKTARYEQQDKPRFEQAVARLCPSCQVLYQNATQDAAKQQQQAESVITDGAKAIVLDAVDVKSAAAIVTRAKQANIPVISYGRLVADAPLKYYVSIDPYAVGRQQAEVQLKAAKAKGVANPRVVMINGSPTDSNAAPYKKGAMDVFSAAGAKIVKSYDTPDWSPDKAQTEMDGVITSAGKDGFDAVYVANDGMATGVVSAMKAAGVDPATKYVTGQDAETAGLQRIVAGSQLMTVYQPIPKIATAAAQLAVSLAQGETPPSITNGTTDNGAGKVPSVLLPTVAIDRANIASTVIKDGWVTAGAICTSEYAKACSAAGLSR